jgi:tRNA(Ile)-lysidine synthase
VFLKRLQHKLSAFQHAKLLLAISGGLDSVVLAHALHAIGFSFEMSHCNYHLRGVESDEDEQFVRAYAENLGVTLHVEHFSDVKTSVENTQQLARNLRYTWFSDLCKSRGMDFLLTAHHAQDNIETFFINALRMCSVQGLRGMRFQQGTLLRPLLDFSRAEISAYALDNHLAYRQDSSNDNINYKRNAIRHLLLPLLEKIQPNALQAFQETQKLLQADDAFLQQQIDKIWQDFAPKQKDATLCITLPIHLDSEQEYVLRKKLSQLYHCNHSVLADIFFAITNQSAVPKHYQSKTYHFTLQYKSTHGTLLITPFVSTV